jgi:hypothetical protein
MESVPQRSESVEGQVIASASFAREAKLGEIIQALIDLRLAPDKISYLCQVPEDSLVGLLPADYCPIEINSRGMKVQVLVEYSGVANLVGPSLSSGQLDLEWAGLRRQVLLNGDTYKGELAEGLPNGMGTYEYAEDGRVCVGSWLKGRMHGYCEINWPSDKQVRGYFVSDRLTGEGKVNWADGRAYEGSLSVDYQLNGFGTFRMPEREKSASS